MNDATIKRLNEINRAFYRTSAESFDESRDRPWPGWDALLPYLKPPLTILDVGCGNGRFGAFLAHRLGTALVYYGIDSNATLLERARAAMSGLNARLELRDVFENPPDSGGYDLVALFGVLHHVPGSEQRREFMRALAQRVAPGGHLALAAWRFYDFARFRERIIPWPDDLKVEPGDYLLDWRRGVHALRYCHYVDDAEHSALIAATGLTEITTYRADGRTNDANRYSVLRRDPV
ncbi:MAG TPA: class I SAM-dependent methyltransferase [Aggregatilineaceae bacterium]|nr:class I SAM-dependent methyltransferase [Aggregatilineaceae bacterium]